MAYKIEFIESSDLVRVEFSGDATLDDRISVIHKICLDFCNATIAKTKILIDVRLITKLMTENEQKIVGTYVASREELKKAKVAIIATPEQLIHQTAIDTSAQLGHRIQLFSTENQALIWLNS
ncbi:hypothetical protein L0668_15415 [Paraglaciecola aquimarina]|uniref:STAS/SEC14 domain-containing protein n=1 Tax=Paraglaciecola algarum TaxID=3050085 RepID=A0ABS9DBX8_9ALTE|nr:hypothetical protein [Paraglaciecola sp. G1-23]MCF2949508.1 hypothetical protein [Paraglaciecola sp. G1-23]